MNLANLTRTEFLTSVGAFPVWHAAKIPDRARPAVVFINKPFGTPAAAAVLKAALGAQADLCWMQMIGDGAPDLEQKSLAAFVTAVTEVLQQAFADRRVILAGQGMGATAALAVRAAVVDRVVALEPELEPAEAWPILDSFRELVRTRPALRPVIEAFYGKALDGSDAPSNLSVLEGLDVPVDVLVGSQPLMPRRAPLTSKRVGYVGRRAAWFKNRHQRRNPLAEVVALTPDDRLLSSTESFDLIVAADMTELDLASVRQGLSPGGVFVAGVLAGVPLPDELGAAGLRVDAVHAAEVDPDVFDDTAPVLESAPRVVIARRTEDPAPSTMRVRIVAYASRMLDVRTRLPAHALRSEPSLQVAYQHAPIGTMRDDTVFVIQRTGEHRIAAWRSFMAMASASRSIVVLEHDDHPEVVSRALGVPFNLRDLEIFGYAHAVQTSTPELAALYRRYNPNVEIFPNAVFDISPPPLGPWAPKIFYGALARGDFPSQVARSLGPILAAHPEASIEVVGDKSVFDALPTTNKRFHPLMPYEAYLELMGQCSILLTPLEGEHNETKSDTKFLDAASRGLATIASPQAYGATIRHGETGLIARGLLDWAPLLARLLDDPQAAQAIAHRAWTYVRGQRMFCHQIAQRHDWYADLMRRREALNAEVSLRIPGFTQTAAAKAQT